MQMRSRILIVSASMCFLMLPILVQAQSRHVNADLIELDGPTKTRLLTGGGVDTVVLELPSQSGTLAAHPMAIAATTGTVVQYAAEPVPSGYVLSRGQNVSRAQYSALYDLIGTTYGAGNGSTTFTLPNLSSIPTDGLVGWWPFNGNANDESGIGTNGVVTGAIPTTDRFGYENSAYYLDGNADIVMANYAAMINSVGTLSCWFKIGQIGKRNFIYITDPGLTNEHFALSWYKYADRLEGDVKYNSQCKPGKGWIKAFTAQSYQDDKWHNVAVTWGDGDVKVYVDNVLAATAVTPVNNADACAGGILIINPIGKVDDLSIYNRIITAEERAMLYDAESPRIMSVVKH